MLDAIAFKKKRAENVPQGQTIVARRFIALKFGHFGAFGVLQSKQKNISYLKRNKHFQTGEAAYVVGNNDSNYARVEESIFTTPDRLPGDETSDQHYLRDRATNHCPELFGARRRRRLEQRI
jgi:hypothetical protein